MSLRLSEQGVNNLVMYESSHASAGQRRRALGRVTEASSERADGHAATSERIAWSSSLISLYSLPTEQFAQGYCHAIPRSCKALGTIGTSYAEAYRLLTFELKIHSVLGSPHPSRAGRTLKDGRF